MQVVFMGTPAFAVPSLDQLHRSRHNVLAVVTKPDTPKGRGQKVVPTPVKEFAISHNLKCFTPENLKEQSFIADLQNTGADVFVVVAFRILPESVFSIPTVGTINLHASLLPHYRGAAPIQRALIAGETKTGVTTFLIDKGIDTGKILANQPVDILLEYTAGDLSTILAQAGAQLILETLDGLESGKLTGSAQPEGDYTKAPKIRKGEGLIQWHQPAVTVHNFIRGLSPEPGAYTRLQGNTLKILRTGIVTPDTIPSVSPGTVLQTSPKNPFMIACGDGFIEILEIQQSGKRVMSSKEFLAGARLNPGDKFV